MLGNTPQVTFFVVLLGCFLFAFCLLCNITWGIIKVDLFCAISKRLSQLPGIPLHQNCGWGSILSFVSRCHRWQRPLCCVPLWLLSAVFLAHIYMHCLKAGAVGCGFSTQVEVNAISLLQGLLISLKLEYLLNVLHPFIFLKTDKSLVLLFENILFLSIE